MTKPRLRVERLCKSFAGSQVLHEISFEAHGGEILGVVGENGCGKSTTMNIIAGILPADAGTVRVDGVDMALHNRPASEAAGIAFIQQELNIFPNLSVAENLFLGRFPRRYRRLPWISRATLHKRAATLLRAVNLSVDPDTAASRLSPGERQLIEIARGLSMDAKVMILDEPTTSLTSQESRRLFDILAELRARGVAIVFISHALEDVLHLSNRLMVLRDGQVTLTAHRAEVDANTLVTAMVGRSIQTLFPVRTATPPSAKAPAAAPVLRVEELTEPGITSGISFDLHAGEIVGIAGLMGSGRTELARILFGLDPHREGRILANGQVLPSGSVSAAVDAGMAFLSEDRRHDGLMLEASVSTNLALAALPRVTKGRLGRLDTRALTNHVAAMAQRLAIKSGPIEHTPVGTLSGGNQQKVMLGRWLLRKPSVFILDEPTRGVDIGAKQEIYRLLIEMADRGMSILVISSELEELIGLCDRILVLRQGRIQARFDRPRFTQENLLKAAFGQEPAA